MATIVTENYKIVLSKLVKNNEEPTDLTTVEFEANLEAILQELVGAGIIVEIEKE